MLLCTLIVAADSTDRANVCQEVAQLTLLKDVLWSDPDSTVHGTAPNPRGTHTASSSTASSTQPAAAQPAAALGGGAGAGCLFGDDIVLAYLSHLGLKHLVRSHQPFFKVTPQPSPTSLSVVCRALPPPGCQMTTSITRSFQLPIIAALGTLVLWWSSLMRVSWELTE